MSEATKISQTFSEEEFGKRMDRCVTDLVMKGATGLVLGSVFSLLFLKRRTWPIIMGTGFGIGASYKTCETAGLITGSVVSLLLFKRRSWPIALGTGMGIGMAFKACDEELNGH